jgi:transcriptional regulator with XRE-family HTH domain
LPFCEVTLKATKPVALPYPDTLNTLGDHIRKRRLDLGLYQKDVARCLGVTTDSVAYWENNRNQPSLRMIPRIIGFLGYDPFQNDSDSLSLGERVVRVRQRLGITQKDLARRLGVDPSTLAHWEYGRRQPTPENRARLEEFIERAATPVCSSNLKGSARCLFGTRAR